VKILIAGFGSAGRRHFRNLTTLGVTDVAFLRSGKSTLAVDEIEGRPVFTALEQAIAWKPDAIVIANPSALHMRVALTAARAGVHLFVEKPLSHTRAGADELCRVSREQQLVTMIGCQYRFHPLLRALRERVSAGEFGAPLTARAEYADSILLWHPWEDYRASYSARPELGGGAILTLVHPLDYLYWLFGPVHDVRASMRKAPHLETDIDDDVADLSIEFQNGVLAQVHLDFVQDPPVHTLTVIGERGRAELDFLAGTLRTYLGGHQPRTERVPHGYDRNSMFVDEMKHFLHCLDTRQQTAVPLGDGIAILDIALAAKADAGRPRD
jgi:predicted dehydrogenase